MNREEIKQYRVSLWKLAQEQRQPFEREFQEAGRYAMPQRPWRTDIRMTQRGQYEEIFNRTAPHRVRTLLTNTTRLLIPRNQPWCEIVIREKLKKRTRLTSRIQMALERANRELFDHFKRRNFLLAVTEALADGIVYGTFCVQVVDDPSRPLHYKAIPLDELYILDNWDDQVDVVFRMHALTGRALLDRFPKAPKELRDSWKDNPTKLYTIREGCFPVEGGKKPFYYCVRLNDRNQEISQDWMSWNPFVVARWEKFAGSCWGNRPIRTKLPDIRAANQISADALAFGSFAANGLWQSRDVNLNTKNMQNRLEPGRIIVTRETLQPVEFPGNYRINLEMIDRLDRRIQQGLFEMMPPDADFLKYAKAESVIFLRDQLFNQIGESALRLMREFLQIIADQTVQRLFGRGDLVILNPAQVRALGVRGPNALRKIFEVDVNAAMKKLLDAQEANETMGAVVRAAQVVGPQQVAAHVNMDLFTRLILENFGVPARIFHTEEEAAAIKKAQEEATGQNLGIQSLVRAMTQSPPEQLDPNEQESEAVA